MLSPNVCPPSPCRICSVRCWPEAETKGRPGASFCGFDKQSVFFRFQVPLYQLCRSLIMDILPYCDRFRVAIGLCFVILFNRKEFCPLEDLFTSTIWLSSDSTSRWTSLPLANPSHYRADSGLSPYRTCAHRAH